MNYLKILIVCCVLISTANGDEPAFGQSPAYDEFERVPDLLKPTEPIELEVLDIFDSIVELPNELNKEFDPKILKYEWAKRLSQHIYGLYPSYDDWKAQVIWANTPTNEARYNSKKKSLKKLIEEQDYHVGICFILKMYYKNEETLIVGLNLKPEYKTFPFNQRVGQGCISFAMQEKDPGEYYFLSHGKGGNTHFCKHIIFNNQKSIMDTLNDMELISVNPFRWKYTPIALRN